MTAYEAVPVLAVARLVRLAPRWSEVPLAGQMRFLKASALVPMII